jgi:serine/threonine protein kinase
LANTLGITDPKALNLMENLLRYNPDDRITCHEALNHSYFDDILKGNLELCSNYPLYVREN